MRLLSALTLVILASVPGSYGKQTKRQDGPVAPDPDPDCTFFDASVDESYDCTYFEEFWGISHADFVAWNPSVRGDCSGLVVGNSYCIEVVRPPSPTTQTVPPSPTTSTRPSPLAPGMIESCVNYYRAVRGDTCPRIVEQYRTFTSAQFIEWNPAVRSDCTGLEAGVYYCVGIPGTPTAAPSSTSALPTNGIATPMPTQPGMVNNCDAFYLVQEGDGCQAIADQHGISLAQFISWQDVGGSSCTRLQASVNVCISIIGHTPTTQAPPTTTQPPGNGIQTPQPTQPGMVGNCDAFYFVRSGDGCQAIADAHGISLAQFISWQDVGGSSCTRLQANVNVCISVVGHTPTTRASSTTTQPPGNGIQTPQPIQPGMVGNCDAFYRVVSGDGCQSIADRHGISLSQFTTWQNVGGAGCPNLQLGVNVCVSIIGHTPTFVTSQPASTCTSAHPTPTQPQSVCNCRRWHRVVSGNTCESIQTQYSQSAANLNRWNPDVGFGRGCARLFLGYSVCVNSPL